MCGCDAKGDKDQCTFSAIWRLVKALGTVFSSSKMTTPQAAVDDPFLGIRQCILHCMNVLLHRGEGTLQVDAGQV